MPRPISSVDHREHIRAGLRVSAIAVAWTVCSSALSIVLALAARSLALLIFGFVGALDAAGSASLVVHFRHALSNDALSERHERVALRIVTSGLIAVGGYGVIEGIHRLVAGERGDTSGPGVAVAATSVVVLTALFVWKRRAAGAIPSPALYADAWLSATGASLAVVTVAGTALSAGWWRADPLAATLIGAAAVAVGISQARG